MANNTGSYNGLSARKFVCDFLAANGPSRVKDIYAALAAARGGYLDPKGQYTPATHLFSREYGFISRGFSDLSIDLGNPGYTFGTNRTTLWYRLGRGVYALNTNGMALAAQ